MSYCLNPQCRQPHNSQESKLCLSCGALLWLKNRYRILKFLDMGGMSRAYLAVDEDTPSKQVCVVKQFFPSPQVRENIKSFTKSVELFQREAAQLDRLGRQSPQIPKLLAYLEQDKTFYLVQEYIDGQNLLRDITQNGAYGEADVRKLLQEVLPVLQFIHEQKIVHRDIKPENIMRRRNDQVVLIDFGMSKQMTEQVTSRGTTGGTMGYAPPEQVRAGIAYPASDLYALGATCIHLLTNVTPDNLYDFQGTRWIWRDLLQEQQKTIGDNLAEIIDKMLQTEVKDRYQSATLVLNDLADSLPRSVRIARRRRWRLLALMTPLAIGAVVLAVLKDQILCRFGVETSACPVAKGPRLINGVLYFPFEPAADRRGKSAEFNMAILSQEYRWQPNSADAVNLGTNPAAIPVKDLKQVMEAKGITKIMENPNQVISVGMASCEGSQQEEEIRAMERAKTIQQQLAKPIFAVKDYPLLNLGQFKRASCSRSSKDNAFQRSMILMGIRKESAGVVLSDALYARLNKISKEFNLNDYTLGSKDKFQVLPSDVRVFIEEVDRRTVKGGTP